MTRLADTVACELAQRAWLGIDAPGEINSAGIREALQRGLPGDVTLEDVGEWAKAGFLAIADAATLKQLEARFVGAIAAALILGAKLQETQGT